MDVEADISIEQTRVNQHLENSHHCHVKLHREFFVHDSIYDEIHL